MGSNEMPANRGPAAVAAALGYAGLVPFLVLAAATGWDAPRATLWDGALIAYAAVILSFVGALHWAFAMTLAGLSASQRNGRFLWSVIPALLAWVALLIPPSMASALLFGAFGLHAVEDWRLSRSGSLPRWYLPLRLRLSVVAAACVVFGSWAAHR